MLLAASMAIIHCKNRPPKLCVDDVAGNGPGNIDRMPFNARNQGSKSAG